VRQLPANDHLPIAGARTLGVRNAGCARGRKRRATASTAATPATCNIALFSTPAAIVAAATAAAAARYFRGTNATTAGSTVAEQPDSAISARADTRTACAAGRLCAAPAADTSGAAIISGCAGRAAARTPCATVAAALVATTAATATSHDDPIGRRAAALAHVRRPTAPAASNTNNPGVPAGGAAINAAGAASGSATTATHLTLTTYVDKEYLARRHCDSSRNLTAIRGGPRGAAADINSSCAALSAKSLNGHGGHAGWHGELLLRAGVVERL